MRSATIFKCLPLLLAALIPCMNAQSVAVPKKGQNAAQEVFIDVNRFVTRINKGITWYDYAWGDDKVIKAVVAFKSKAEAAQVPAFTEDLEGISETLRHFEQFWDARNTQGAERVYCEVTVEFGALCARWPQFVTRQRNEYTGKLSMPSLDWQLGFKWYDSELNRYAAKALEDLQASPFAMPVK